MTLRIPIPKRWQREIYSINTDDMQLGRCLVFGMHFSRFRTVIKISIGWQVCA